MTTSDVRIRFVLVHGACHGAWTWETVAPRLEAHGWLVTAPELPFTSMHEDARVVRDAVAAARERGERVILVGHSYGGGPITQGGAEADHLVYAAAAVPDVGEPTDDERTITPEALRAAVMLENNTVLSMDPQHAAASFLQRTDPDLARRAVERLRPQPVLCFEEPLTEAAWRHVPSSYIVATDDRSFATDFQRVLAARVRDVIELDCDHSMYYSATDGLVRRLEEIAAEVASR
ncbi:alpha/beta fold hydrolase [Microbacterium atlanticum]|uniref:alpha/beta fold hydrolase n=1 Tax=Microbacterium atlanticum TaxID=2782168 RepID=UPI001886FA30|nr:alpha/beta fold hydrolase [Microbacterium atlanticum]